MDGTYFTASHEWICIEGSKGTVGITKFAKEQLGEVVFVQLPFEGEELQAGSAACVLESTKAASDVHTPVSGRVLAVNKELIQSPEMLHKASQGKDWLFQIELKDSEVLADLLSLEQYQQLIS